MKKGSLTGFDGKWHKRIGLHVHKKHLKDIEMEDSPADGEDVGLHCQSFVET